MNVIPVLRKETNQGLNPCKVGLAEEGSYYQGGKGRGGGGKLSFYPRI